MSAMEGGLFYLKVTELELHTFTIGQHPLTVEQNSGQATGPRPHVPVVEELSENCKLNHLRSEKHLYHVQI